MGIPERSSPRTISEHLNHLAAKAATLILVSFGSLYIYWHYFDTLPPIQNIRAEVVSYDKASGQLVVKWTAYKNRYCHGERNGWIRESGNEPPPRLTESLSSVVLPPEDFRGKALPAGQDIVWKTMVDVPVNTPDPFVYGAEWLFHCNPLQSDDKGIRVESPPLHVGG